MPTFMQWAEPRCVGRTPLIKNHTATAVRGNKLYVFGGYDGRRNHNSVHILDCDTYTWRFANECTGKIPPARNGHTATLAKEKIFIIGGWLGHGPLAADDMYVLQLDGMLWEKPTIKGQPPGPCNMHTADYIEHLNEIFVFRGGDGQAYLNDIHAVNVDTYTWEKKRTFGQAPIPRANHSSAVVGNKLYIFGGWDGHRRLNDIHILDTETMHWSCPEVKGTLPHPRAGMTFTAANNRIFLFGGSGPAVKCFNDLQILDTAATRWLDIDSAGDATSKVDKARAAKTLTDGPHPLMITGSDESEANPNDDCASVQHKITIQGQYPGWRAGHTATIVGRHLIVFGGSLGTDYYSDFWALDIDPLPKAKITDPPLETVLLKGLKCYMNDPAFSDVTFIVEGKPIHAHRVILSSLSERFRVMFQGGFRESTEREVYIEDISYSVFMKLIEYFYTGEIPHSPISPSSSSVSSSASSRNAQATVDQTTMNAIEMMMELLQAADQFMLDHLKQVCETVLQDCVTWYTVEYLTDLAERANAWQLLAVCQHYLRNNRTDDDNCDMPTTAGGTAVAKGGMAPGARVGACGEIGRSEEDDSLRSGNKCRSEPQVHHGREGNQDLSSSSSEDDGRPRSGRSSASMFLSRFRHKKGGKRASSRS